MRKRLLVGLTGGFAALVMLASASAAPSGSLRLVEENLSASLSNANDVAVAPDGRQVYGVGFASGEIGVFDRNANTGAIDFADATEGDGLVSPNAVTVSRDGDNVYVAGNVSDSVHAYERGGDGTLNNIDAVTDGDGGVTALGGAYDVAAVGPHVYATGSDEDGVVLMNRDGDGELTFQDEFINGLEDIASMEQPRGIAVSPDGRNVYVASAGDGAIVVFRRFANTGQLDFVEFDAGFFSPAHEVAVSPDGKRVYVSFDDGFRTFRRAPATGALTFLGFSDEPSNTTGVAASPDGANVYTSHSSLDEGIMTFATTRNAKPRFRGLAEVSFNDSTAVAASDDGRHVYLAGGTAGNGHIAVFSRQPELELTGKKSQKASKLKVKAECSADCKVTLRGKGLKQATSQLEAGRPKTLKLKGGDPGKVTVKGKAKAGNRSDGDRLKVKLK